MNKEEFLKQLEQLLSDINPAEREEALQYYREYFEDANMADEDVIRELGSVQAVADSIREDLEDKELVPIKEKEEEKQNQKEEKVNYFEFEEKKKEDTSDKQKMSTGLVVAIVLVAILFSPAILGITMGIFGALLGIFGTLAGLFIASAACMIAFAVAAVGCLVGAIVKMFTSPVASLILLGTALICLGLCSLSTLLTLKMVTVVIPGILKGIRYLVSLPGRKKEAVA